MYGTGAQNFTSDATLGEPASIFKGQRPNVSNAKDLPSTPTATTPTSFKNK